MKEESKNIQTHDKWANNKKMWTETDEKKTFLCYYIRLSLIVSSEALQIILLVFLGVNFNLVNHI